MSFSFIMNFILGLVDLLVEFSENVLYGFSVPIGDSLFSRFLPDIALDLVGKWTMLDLMFGVGLPLFIGYTLVKWFLDIIL